jgi:hypothetical protein
VWSDGRKAKVRIACLARLERREKRQLLLQHHGVSSSLRQIAVVARRTFFGNPSLIGAPGFEKRGMTNTPLKTERPA